MDYKRKARDLDDDEEDQNLSDEDQIRSSKNNKLKKNQSSSSNKKSKAIIDEDDDDEEISNKKSKKNKKSKAIIDDDDEEDEEENLQDDEAEDLDDDEDEEEDEEDEEANAEEFNDFIDDNNDEVDDEDDIKGKKKKKEKKKSKKKKKKSKEQSSSSKLSSDDESNKSGSSSSSQDELSELEEDDLELIKDNLNVDDLEEVGIKKTKRVKQLASDSSDENEEIKKRKKEKPSSNIKLSKKDRRNEEVDQEEAEGDEMEEEKVNENYEDESDEGGSFIVDDSDDENRDEDGEGDAQSGNRDSRMKDKSARKKRMYTDEAQQEAMDIFGVNAEELGAISEDEDENVEDEEEDYEEEDDEELIDDDEETGTSKKKSSQRRTNKSVQHKIEDIFEPEELEKNLMTEQDQRIRLEDKPERFMLRQIAVQPEPDELELEREAEWIYTQAFSSSKSIISSNQDFSQSKSPNVIPKIKDTLNFIRNEFYEVPFIHSYRKEYIQPDLSLDDLWCIYDWDEKYCQLKQRKENLFKLYQRMQKYQYEQMNSLTNKQQELQEKKQLDENQEEIEEEEQAILRIIETIRILEDSDLDKIKQIQNLDEFNDYYNHFHLHYGSELIQMKEFELRLKLENQQENEEEAEFNKYASKKDKYHHCKMIGLNSLTRKFGLSPEQFGENLLADYQKNEIEQWPTEPAHLCQDFLESQHFQNVDQILTTVRYMLALQFARDPQIRSYVRDLYMKNVCINVKPTMPRGFKEIDETHSCYSYKYLNMKPCSSLCEDEYLKIAQAEQDGLLAIKFELSNLKNIVTTTSNETNTNDNDDWDDGNKNVDTTSQITPQTVTMSLIEKLKSFYQKDEFSYNVEQWNLQRSMIIDEMFTKYLLPEFEKELRSKLLNEAKQFVFRECSKKLRSILNVAPYTTESISLDDEIGNSGLKVLSICYDDSNSNYGVCSCITGDGDLDEFIRLSKLTYRLRSLESLDDPLNDKEKVQDIKLLEDFIETKKPNVIVVSAENKDSLQICDDLRFILKKLDNKEINIELLDNEMAKLFESSKTSQVEFANLPNLVRQSVCLARQIQDPLLCYSQLCNQDRDILSLKLHPMQQIIIAQSGSRKSDDSQQLLVNYLEREFINIVNDVGVDLNKCNQSPHTAQCLQFVCGLGPRKAQHILKVLRQGRLQLMSKLGGSDRNLKTYPVAVSRLYLVTKCDIGRIVLINSAGFIKFDVDKIMKEIEDDEDIDNDDKEDVELLDSTRIHPEHYEWARKMAIDALDFDDNNDSANSQSALKEILYENPKRLKDLDLDAFAAELIRTGYGNKATTLYDIRAELSSRYRDRRLPYQPMNDEIKFFCIIKETPKTFYVGKLIMCRVNGTSRKRPTKEQLDEANPYKDDNTGMWVCQFCKRNDFNDLSKIWNHFDALECPGPPTGIRVLLDNGCNGFIPLKFLSDNPVSNPEERIKIGMIIHARIRRIDVERFGVELTSKTSDLRDLNDQWKPKKDSYYDYRAQEADQSKLDEKKKKEEHKQTYTKRVIAHPQFKNIGYQQAVIYLKDMDIGECVIRPSSKGSDHLTVTWKVNENCFQHVDVLEEKKMNAFSIGKRLIIDGEDFEDLDEIIARYVNPMANYVREIMSHKNYKTKNDLTSSKSVDENENNAEITQNIERYLLDERSKNPSRIPYCFTCCLKYPGKFMISYMIKLKVRSEYITVTHEGFKFRLKMFKTFNELISWFKLHFNDPLPISLSSTNTSSSQFTQPIQNTTNENIENNSQMMMNKFNTISINNQNNQNNNFDQIAFGDSQYSQNDSFSNRRDYENNDGGYRGGGRGRGGRGGGRGGGGRGGYRGGRNDNFQNNRFNNYNDRGNNDFRKPNNNTRFHNNDDYFEGNQHPVQSVQQYQPPPATTTANDDEMWD